MESLEPCDNPFWGFRYGVKKERRKKKIVVTMFAWHLYDSSGKCLHLARTNISPPHWVNSQQPMRRLAFEVISQSDGQAQKNLKYPGGRGGGPNLLLLDRILIFFWVRSPYKVSEPYDIPFWEIRYCNNSELLLEQFGMGFVRPKSDGLFNIRAVIKSF